MTTIASRTQNDTTAAPPRRLGVSGRLVLVTIAVVLLAQILVFVPSLAMFRRGWINDRLVGAKMVALVLAAYPEGAPLPREVEGSLVAGIPAPIVALRGNGTRWLEMRPVADPPADAFLDLREPSWLGPLRGLFRTVFMPADAPRRVYGPGVPGMPQVAHVEVIFEESYLRAAMLSFTRAFLVVSLVVSAIAAGLMFLVLHRFLVRPFQRLTTNIASFSEAPEDAARIIRPSGRTDEIGLAERALARMQASLAGELRQKRRLAEIGLAVSKINHELRNMLTTAQLLGDRLAEIDDPTVKRIAPRLIRTLARAIEFCGATLAYGRAVERPPQIRPLRLKPLVAEIAEPALLTADRGILLDLAFADDLTLAADPEQLGRALANLIRNAVQALRSARTPAPAIRIEAWRDRGRAMIRVADNGPGIPSRLRDRLFGAFESSERPDGTGLGLNIAEELIRMHGGTVELEPASPGASFLICLPDRGV